MKFIFWISRKLRLNGSKGGANATGVVIAVTGVALALIIMEFTIAIVLGFKNQITDRILGFDGEIWVLPEYNISTGQTAQTLDRYPELMHTIDSVIPGNYTELRISQPGILKTDNDFAGVYFTSFENTHDFSFEKSNMIEGDFPDYSDSENSNKIVLSKQTATSLNLALGDKISSYFFIDEAIKARKFEIAGIYESGFGDYDRTIVYAPMNTMQKVLGTDSLSGSRLSIDVPKDIKIEDASFDLQSAIISDYNIGANDRLHPVEDVKKTGALYFNWLELLNTNVVVIFILMICVSGFTLVSSMFIIILERISTIGILRSLGCTKRQIREIFINMTLRIVGIGLLIGNVVGIGLLLLQKTYRILSLDPEMYYLKYVPVEMNYPYFIYLNIGVIIISWLILILPSRMASNISPAVTMRFE